MARQLKVVSPEGILHFVLDETTRRLLDVTVAAATVAAARDAMTITKPPEQLRRRPCTVM